MRFEDIDEPRNQPGAIESQLHDMRLLGLEADETVVQSRRRSRHLELFLRAVREGWVYSCSCSRKDVRDALERAASAPHGVEAIYNGRCRQRLKVGQRSPRDGATPTLAWRFRNDDESGARDFIVARTFGALNGDEAAGIHLSNLANLANSSNSAKLATFYPAYNWACAIDDYEGGYRLLVRASDLASVVEQQRAVYRMLADWGHKRPVPAVFHSSLVTRSDGVRLEKRMKGITLAELAARGISPREVMERFSATFLFPRLDSIVPGAVLREPESEITLSTLQLD